jgi:hypothetical protein
MSDERIDDYLWERTGEGDQQLRDLEELLARYRITRSVSTVFEAVESESEEPAGG